MRVATESLRVATVFSTIVLLRLAGQMPLEPGRQRTRIEKRNQGEGAPSAHTQGAQGFYPWSRICPAQGALVPSTPTLLCACLLAVRHRADLTEGTQVVHRLQVVLSFDTRSRSLPTSSGTPA